MDKSSSSLISTKVASFSPKLKELKIAEVGGRDLPKAINHSRGLLELDRVWLSVEVRQWSAALPKLSRG